jgi:hypothetical protein
MATRDAILALPSMTEEEAEALANEIADGLVTDHGRLPGRAKIDKLAARLEALAAMVRDRADEGF